MKKTTLLFLFINLVVSATFAQKTHAKPGKSVMQEESEKYSKFTIVNDASWDTLRRNEVLPYSFNSKNGGTQKINTGCNLNKRVYGWHPYWNGNSYNNYNWSLLTDLCYFDYTVNPTNGNNSNVSFDWMNSAAVTAAKNNGKKISFTVTLFSNHSAFLSNAASKNNLITNVITLLQQRGGNGVCVDFEQMSASNRVSFTAFIQDLCIKVHAAIPGSEVSIALYTVDWNNVFDIPNLKNYIDLFAIMGYDYYYSGSPTAGPSDPLYTFDPAFNYSLSRSITDYLNAGVPNNKLLLGLPYYGREWQTVSNAIPAATIAGTSTTRTLSYVKANASAYSKRLWNPTSYTSYYDFQSLMNWKQLFINDGPSLEKRLDVVNKRTLAGIGIWALGYDNGYNDYWNAIRNVLTDCSVENCADTIFDMGGPGGSYYNNEDYRYTISSGSSGDGVSLVFKTFQTELNKDFLSIYDGASTSSPLIGTYSGTISPGTVKSTGRNLTIRFTSNGLNTATGFWAVKSCFALGNCANASSLNVTNITSTAAQLSWSGVQSATYSINVRPVGTTSWTTYTSSSSTLLLNNLAASTNYEWQLKVNCTSMNASGYTSGAPFKTLSTPCNSPSIITASSVNTSILKLNWPAVTGVANYILEWKDQTAINWSSVTVTTNNYVLSGLSASTAYQCRVKSVCSSTTSAASPVAIFITRAACYDANENNNTASTATSISNGNESFGKICSGDVDWFKFSSSTKCDITIDLSQLGANYDMELFFNGTYVTGKYSLGTVTEIITRTSQPAGNYLVKIFPATSTDVNLMKDYRLLVTFSPSQFIFVNPNILGNGEKKLTGSDDEDMVLKSLSTDESDQRSAVLTKHADSLSTTVSQNFSVYPNPTSSKTYISYRLAKPECVSVNITDLFGKELTVINGTFQDMGNHVIEFSKEDYELTPGIYFIKLRTPAYELVKKFIIQ